MRGLKMWFGVCALLVVGAIAQAQDKTSFWDGDNEFVTESKSGKAPDSITSMRDNAQVKIGGKATLRYAWTGVGAARGTFAAPGPGLPGEASKFYSSTWEPYGLDLRFDIKSNSECDDISLRIRMELKDTFYANGNYGQDELAREAYFTMKNVWGSGLGLKVGKMEVPLVYNKNVLLMAPYLDGSNESFLRGRRNGINSWYEDNFFGIAGSGANREFRWDPNRITKIDRVFAIAPFYQVCDSLLLETSIFQSRERRGRENVEWNGGYVASRYTNDAGLSFSGRATWTPVKDLKISLGGAAINNRSYSQQYDDKGRYYYASSLAFDYTMEIACKNVNLFAEWVHGWDPGFTYSMYSDDIHTGVSIGLTDKITALAQYEWLRGEYRNINRTQVLHRAVLALQYELAKGLNWEGGFQREWGRFKSSTAAVHPTFNGKNSAYANTIYTGLNFSF